MGQRIRLAGRLICASHVEANNLQSESWPRFNSWFGVGFR